MDSIASLPGINVKWQFLKNDERPPKALLLEFFEGARQLSPNTITPVNADAALRALYHVHASYLMHNDMHGRNILVLPSGRVVWVDFDSSWPSWKSDEENLIRRQEPFGELVRTWIHFYDEPVRYSSFSIWS